MRSSSPGLKIGIGVAVAVLAVMVFVRMGRQAPDAASPPDATAPHQPMKPSDRVQQRLKQLQVSRSAGLPAGERGELADRLRVASRRTPRASDAARGAAAAPDLGQEAADEPTPFDTDPDDIPALTKILTEDPDPERRLAAVTLLGSSDDPEVIPTLAKALSDQDEEVRMAALQALSDFTDEPPVEAIESALNDTSADIRFEALDVLSDIGGDRVRPAIEKALNDPDEDVRSLAEGILDFEQLYEATPGDSQPQDTGTGPGNQAH
jgi:HEAT repeat protein/PBS lyase HEAT-like repeat-containing protein